MNNIYNRLSTLLVALLLIAPLAGSALAQTPGTLANGGVAAKSSGADALVPQTAESGFIFLSIDGCGSSAASCEIEVEKPAGATVRKAFLATSRTQGGLIGDNVITVDGTPIAWDATNNNGIFDNHWADITSIVKPKMDAAATGRTSFTVGEANISSSVDGSVIAVIFDDPNATSVSTAVLTFGGQALSGDTFSVGLADPFSDATQDIVMSLGISFGYQPAGQYSIVEVNGARLTTSAGGYDDGEAANGALLTVGGLDDSEDNPPDPNATDSNGFDYDDELYTLDPLLVDGANTISIFSQNPSNDDNIFFAAFLIRGTAAVIGEGITLGPTEAENPINTDHTVTATIQDDNGSPVEGASVDFEIISGPNTGLTGNATTGADGKADFTWSSSVAGTDVVVARFTSSQQQVLTSNEARKTWIDDQQPPTTTIVLGPENATNPVGTDHTVTAVVKLGADPVEGAEVEFEIISGPNTGLTATATTDANGEASFTWTGNFEGQDVVVARTDGDDDQTLTSNEARKNWVNEQVCEDPSWDGSVTYDADMAYLGISVPGGVVEAELYNASNLVALGVFDASFNDITSDFTVTGSGGNVKYTYSGAGPAPEYINIKIDAPNEGSSRFFLRVSNDCTTVDIDPVITVDIDSEVADSFVVFQNYPNPFRTNTTISFEIATAGNVTVAVYDVLGQRVRTVLSEELPSGLHMADWDGRNDAGETVSSGIYLYRVENGQHTATRTMTLLR